MGRCNNWSDSNFQKIGGTFVKSVFASSLLSLLPQVELIGMKTLGHLEEVRIQYQRKYIYRLGFGKTVCDWCLFPRRSLRARCNFRR